jgi:hypothetical protein
VPGTGVMSLIRPARPARQAFIWPGGTVYGYVRPHKPELLVREFSRYRSVYCGICKQIGHDYGQIPRLTLGYELTLLAVLLLSLAEDQPPVRLEACVLNPLLKKPIVRGGAVLELCAGLSVLLAWAKAADNARDEKAFKKLLAGLLAQNGLAAARRRARRRYPAYDRIIGEGLAALARYEAGQPDPAAADAFGALLKRLFREAAALVTERADLREALGLFGYHLGCWIYLIDAIDDWASDCNNGDWNPFSLLDAEQARAMADDLLQEHELAMDRTAALLPYRQDSGLMANIVTQGLQEIRRQVLLGEKPGRL